MFKILKEIIVYKITTIYDKYRTNKRYCGASWCVKEVSLTLMQNL